jgi:SAM-dependent methyltransferase
VAPDPLLYRGCAAHYLRGRPPYSGELGAVLTRELGLDGHGTLVDVGCGPGVLAVQLASLFDDVVGIDPDPDMLAEAERHALAHGHPGIDWRTAHAEDIAALALSPARVVTFGQSFHWTERELVAAAVYDMLVPGGALVAVAHDTHARPQPRAAQPADPPIPDGAIRDLIASYLGGPGHRVDRAVRWLPSDRYEDALARSCFGHARTVHAPGREDLTRDVDGVISGYLSMSYAAPHLFGDRLDSFITALRALLTTRTTTGRFRDWPGDTAVIIATKPE